MKAFKKAVLLAFTIGAIVIAASFVVHRALSVVVHDEAFMKIKPTIVNALFCAILLISFKLGKPKRALHLTETGWRRLTLHWALFFFLLAAFNEIIWRSQSTYFWLTWNAITSIPIITLFAFSQVPLLLPDKVIASRDGAALEEEVRRPS
jgi:intracellular septation protein